MNRDVDLLIVGGGLAGGSLALALRNTPLRIAIIESVDEAQRQASPAGDRALALAWGSAQILDQLGVWAKALPKATPIKHIHVSDRGHFGKVRMNAGREHVPALGYVATARVLEDGIVEALADSAVTLYRPARLQGLKAGHDGIHVTLKQGEDAIQLTAGLVVGADGGNSTVRKLLEIGQNERDYGQTAIVTEVTTDRHNRHTAYERFTPSGPLALLPVGKHRSSVVWTLSHEDAQATLSRSDGDFRDLLQDAFGYWLGRLTLASRRQGFPLKLIRAQRMTDRRVVLIGNAVHQLHPVAGQGFNLGLRDVALLAEMLAARVQFGDDIGDQRFLDGFALARQRDLDRVIGFTDSMVRIFSNEYWPLTQARNLGLLLLNNLPPAKRLLARYAMGVGDRLPRFV